MVDVLLVLWRDVYRGGGGGVYRGGGCIQGGVYTGVFTEVVGVV